MSTEWRVLPHEPLQKLEENLWFVIGNLEGGAPLKRTMAVAKRRDGKLVIHNAVALEDELMKELESHGELAYLLVPNGFHRLDAPRFKARYPSIKVLCPEGARAKVAKVIAVDGTYADFPADPDCTSAKSTSEGAPPIDAGVDDAGDAGDPGVPNGDGGGCNASGSNALLGPAALTFLAALIARRRRR